MAAFLKKYRYFYTGLIIVFAIQTYRHFMYDADYTLKAYLFVLLISFATLGAEKKFTQAKNNG